PKPERPRKKVEHTTDIRVNFIDISQLSAIQSATPWIKRTIAELEYKAARNRLPNDRYCVIGNMLYTKPTTARPHPAIILPREHPITMKIIENFHTDPTLCAHLGIYKTKEAIIRRFFWTNMQEDITKFIKECIKCNQRKKDPHNMTVEPGKQFSIPEKPFERVHMDIMGPLPRSCRNNAYVLTMQDAFSKFAITIPIPAISTEIVIDKFLRHLVYIFGPPSRLITDRGSNFMSHKFTDLCK
ncbi:unnamed protein product, partial [Auanema sp. JU1783]